MLTFFNKKVVRSFSFIEKMNKAISASSERTKRVQQNVLQQNYAIQMQAKLRNKVNIQSSIEELQKQLVQQIAKSLGRSQTKVKFFIQKAQEKYKQLSKLSSKQSKQKEIAQYNMLIDLCVKARWQFLIHRQSCGFTIKNYELVHTLYPIPPKIL